MPWRRSSRASGDSGAAPREQAWGAGACGAPASLSLLICPEPLSPSALCGGKAKRCPPAPSEKTPGPLAPAWWGRGQGGQGTGSGSAWASLCGSHALRSAPGAPLGSARGYSLALSPPGEDLAPLRPPLTASPPVPLVDAQLAVTVPLG